MQKYQARGNGGMQRARMTTFASDCFTTYTVQNFDCTTYSEADSIC